MPEDSDIKPDRGPGRAANSARFPTLFRPSAASGVRFNRAGPIATMSAASRPHDSASADALAQHGFGRFQPLRLEGRSRRTMAWRVGDPRRGHECLLVMPGARPPQPAPWEQTVRRGARLVHPTLAPALEVDHWKGWPYALYDLRGLQTLEARLLQRPPGLAEAVAVLAAVLQGLAYAHDGAMAHHDLQPCMVLVGETQGVRLAGLEVGRLDPDAQGAAASAPVRTHAEALDLQPQRDAARVDVLAAGLLLHRLLAGRPPLDEPDLGALVERIEPRGREWLRLPWQVAHPVPDALRAIANRCTDRQQRRRYGSARGMLRALEGWLAAEGEGGGSLALLADRLLAAGTLPASAGNAERVARLARMDRQRTNELAEVVLEDLALTFELLRAANAALSHGALSPGSGPVLTVRRAIAIIGLEGVQRAAVALRTWPGPLAEGAARELRDRMRHARRAGRVAQALRPAGYDAEATCLTALLQNLGGLVAAYHFPDEWQQIRSLVQGAVDGDGETDPGMDEQAAACAVLGTDFEAIAAAVVRAWGVDETVLAMMRRLPLSRPPRSADTDGAVLRAVGSCANEALDTLGLPAPSQPTALRRVAQRYARPLGIGLRDLQRALGLPAGRRAAAATEPVDAARA